MDLNECGGCRSLGECCRFAYAFPSPHGLIRSDVACPYRKPSGLCGVFPHRVEVPWCDFDAVKNRDNEQHGAYPRWCPHGDPQGARTFGELFAEKPFSTWTEVQRADFRAFVNRQVVQQFRAGYPEWAHLLGPDGRSTVREAREGDAAETLRAGSGPGGTGALGALARAKLAPDRSPGEGAPESGSSDMAPPG